MADEPIRREPDSTSSSSVPLGQGDRPADREVSDASAPFVPPDEQQTVISKRPPVSEPHFRQAAGPLELGSSLEGQQLGHFQLEEFVGGGGMGAVFRASDTMLGRTVAVKVVSSDQTDEETLRRFRNEAQSAARLDHPNIARVYYVGEDRGWNYIVFEFIEGVNVRDLVDQRGPLPLDEAISYILQVAEALQHASHRDVVHRDIKPSNVLIMPDGKVKLVDMGLARLHQVESSSADLTASGVTLGTFDYISPEQARDPRSADVRSDLYSLGCTLYFILTGFPPFPEGTVLQKLLSHSSEPAPDPRVYRPDLPEGITKILNRLLAKSPNQRYQEPSELIGALLLLASQLGLTTISRSGTVWITNKESTLSLLERHLPWVAPIVMLLLIVAALQAMTGSTAQLAPPRSPQGPQIETTRLEPLEEPVRIVAPDTSNLPDPAGEGDGADNDTAASAPTGEAAGDTRIERSVPTSPSSAATATAEAPVADPATTGTAGTAPTTPGRVFPPGTANTANSTGTTGPTAQAASTGSNLVIVSPTMMSAPSQAKVVRTLADAFQEASTRSEVDTIELRFDRIEERSFEIARSAPLTVRAGEGYEPQVTFQLSGNEYLAPTPGALMRIAGATLRFEGVHFELQMPEEPFDSSALFYLDEAATLSLFSCTMTILDVYGTHYDVAFFELAPPEPPSMMAMVSELDKITTEVPQIELVRCIARGQAALLHASEALPFEFTWDQGLLATSKHVFKIGGATTKVEWPEHRRMDVLLRNVTLRSQRSICHLFVDDMAPYLLEFHPRWEDCIFLVEPESPFLPSTSTEQEPAALVEYEGTDDADAVLNSLSLRGVNNYYADLFIILRIQPADVQYTLREMDELMEQDWYQEKGAQSGSRLRWEEDHPIDQPVHMHTSDDYRLASSRSLMSSPGFDPSLLPPVGETRASPRK